MIESITEKTKTITTRDRQVDGMTLQIWTLKL